MCINTIVYVKYTMVSHEVYKYMNAYVLCSESMVFSQSNGPNEGKRHGIMCDKKKGGKVSE